MFKREIMKCLFFVHRTSFSTRTQVCDDFSNYNWKNCMQFSTDTIISSRHNDNLTNGKERQFFSITHALISLTIITNNKLFSSVPMTSYSSHFSLVSANPVHAIILVESFLFRCYFFQQGLYRRKMIIGLPGISSILWNS